MFFNVSGQTHGPRRVFRSATVPPGRDENRREKERREKEEGRRRRREEQEKAEPSHRGEEKTSSRKASQERSLENLTLMLEMEPSKFKICGFPIGKTSVFMIPHRCNIASPSLSFGRFFGDISS